MAVAHCHSVAADAKPSKVQTSGPSRADAARWHDHCESARADFMEELVARRPDELDNPNEGPNREKYRDNDDVRDPERSDQRVDTKSDSKSEARGDARENVGSNVQRTDANPTGPERNDKTRR